MLEFVAKKGRYDVRIRVLYYRHHDQTRYDKLHVLEAAHLTNAATYQIAKNHKIEPYRNRRWH